MTIASSVSKVTLNGDGVQTSWPFSFKVWKADDLEVILTSPGGAESVTTDWSVVLAGTGGTVTYPVLGDTLPTGWKITIRRSMDFLQEVDLVSGTRWDPEVVETALDQAAAERQQLREEIGRAVRVGVASTEDPSIVLNQVFEARDDAAASAGAAAASESNAADSAAAAQLAASQIGVLTAEGTLTAGQDTITLPFAYDFENEALAVYLGGIRQNKASLTFVDAYTVVLDTPVGANTDYIAASITLEGESILTGLRDEAVAAKDGAEDARDDVLAALVPASETQAGIVELNTTAEAAAGEDTTRAVTAAGVDAYHKEKNIRISASAPASGAAVDFGSGANPLPAGIKRITIMFDAVSTNGTSQTLIRLGSGGAFKAADYVAGAVNDSGASSYAPTTGHPLDTVGLAAGAFRGYITFVKTAGNTWIGNGSIFRNTGASFLSMSVVTLTSDLDSVRVTTVNGTDQFDAGTINISWEF